MKTMQKWTSVFFAMIMCFAMFAFSSCGGSKEKTYTAYEITVLYENGKPATDVYVQLCTIDETTGELGMCYQPAKVDAKGKIEYSPAGFPGAGVYEIHVLDANYQAVEVEGETITKAVYGAYTVTIK